MNSGPYQRLVAGTELDLLVYAVLLGLGFLSCFFGYRLFRLLLGLWGFAAGAAIALTLLQGSGLDPLLKITLAVVGGVAGAALVSLLYAVGVFLFGAGFGLLVASVAQEHLRAASSPGRLIVILVVVGGVAALLLQRPLIKLFTALGRAWILVACGAAPLAGCPIETFPAHCLRSSPWALALLGAWAVLGLLGFSAQTRLPPARRAREDSPD